MGGVEWVTLMVENGKKTKRNLQGFLHPLDESHEYLERNTV